MSFYFLQTKTELKLKSATCKTLLLVHGWLSYLKYVQLKELYSMNDTSSVADIKNQVIAEFFLFKVVISGLGIGTIILLHSTKCPIHMT